MGLFRRKRREDPPTQAAAAAERPEPAGGAGEDGGTGDAAHSPAAPTASEAVTTASPDLSPADTARALGPTDRSSVEDDGGYVDLGAIWVPGIEGLMLTMEVDEATGDVTAVRAHHGDSLLQLQAFAAPKSSGIWDEIRDELVEGVTAQGGDCEQSQGPFGVEVLARIPGRDVQRSNVTTMRFVGFDGPRWFLRGVLSGPAAADAQVAAPLLDLFGLVVVVRGDEPMAPRELLPLRLPAETPDTAEAPTAVEAQAGGNVETHGRPASTEELNPFERGPEITETR